MRSITSISAVRATCARAAIIALVAVGAAPLAAGGASAQTNIPLGCFERSYSADHIARHPAQITDWLRLRMYHDAQYDTVYADLVARIIDQGRMKGSTAAGHVLDQVLTCWSKRGEVTCAVDCDGGYFDVVKSSARSITIETSYLTIGAVDGCGGQINFVEVQGQPVRYRLDRVADTNCEDN